MTDELYRDASAPVAARVEDLLARMRLEEKVAQLGAVIGMKLLGADGIDDDRVAEHLADGIGEISLTGTIDGEPARLVELVNRIQRHLVEKTRLGIPAIFHEEALAGLSYGAAANFPTAIALAATWDPESVEAMNAVTRRQMRALGMHQALSPNLDVARDVRWGRIQETYGEDPYLVSAMGVAFVRGLQGASLTDGVIATGKHFVGYGFADGGRNIAPVHVGDRELREVHVRPFGAAIREAHLHSVMCAYSDVNGEPAASSRSLLTTVLRDELGFDGFTVADYYAIEGLHNRQRTAISNTDAGIQAIAAGLDVELPDRACYDDGLADAVRGGALDESVVDRSVARVLAAKFGLGLFEEPYVAPDAFAATGGRIAGRDVARRLATRSVTLLANPRSVLPLSRVLGRIAVLGPGAHSVRNLFGGYTAVAGVEMFAGLMEEGVLEKMVQGGDDANMTTLLGDLSTVTERPSADALVAIDSMFGEVPTVLRAIEGVVGDRTEVVYSEGCGANDPSTEGIAAAVELAASAEVAVLVLGNKSGMAYDCTTGENRDRSVLELPGAQQQLLDAVCATGTPVVVVLFGSHPVPIVASDDGPAAVLCAWLPGSVGGVGVADVLFGIEGPSGRLPVTFPRSAGQCPIYHGSKQGGAVSVYTDLDDSGPLYPFGHGLTYGIIEYRSLTIGATEVSTHDTVPVTVEVANVGDDEAEEVVQLYARVSGRRVTRPEQELIGFARVPLRPGDTRRVTFDVDLGILAYYDVDMQLVMTPGPVEVLSGPSAGDLPLSSTLTVVGERTVLAQRDVFLTDCRMT